MIAPALLGPAALSLLGATAVGAAPADIVNELRADGCSRLGPDAPPLNAVGALDDVAREFARRGSLPDAFEGSGYVPQTSASLHLGGARTEAELRELLRTSFCDRIGDNRYHDIGAWQRRGDTWIVLAARLLPPAGPDPTTTAQAALEAVNVARAAGGRCGSTDFDPAGPLSLSPLLNRIALAHAEEMAERRIMSHEGADGSLAGERITRGGYAWLGTAENVAAGQPDAAAVVAAWVASPGHCANLMDPRFTEMGIAFALAPDANPAIYWTQLFALPRPLPAEATLGSP